VSDNRLIDIAPLGARWQTLDPFLFCAYHKDAYPPGNKDMGPMDSLAGRAIGQDFSGKDGWSMYHGERVPGFPQHPHRGFETVTVVRQGFIDHSDSLGASARFGEGDLQWMTAGRGIVHSEIFPLLQQEADNPTELFQIWLNLPAGSKMVDPYFSMFWRHHIPSLKLSDTQGLETTIVNYCGPSPGSSTDGDRPPPPPPDSWAADPANGVVIWTIRIVPGAVWTIPATDERCNRRLFYFDGSNAEICGQTVTADHAVTLAAGQDIPLRNGLAESEFLLLQGLPIGEPVAHYGPFIMNDEQGLRQAFADYQTTGFGGWPWPNDGPTHPRSETCFAKHPDGRLEKATD